MQLYNFLFLIILPIILIRIWIKSFILKSYKKRILERLGFFTLPLSYNKNYNIWIHAVSVGEIMGTIPIIKQLKEFDPKINILLTCTTPRGSEIIWQHLRKDVYHVYLPFDVSFAINNFIKKVNPKILLIVEKELWPNIIFHCNKHNIPVIIANAQLSKKSLSRYLMIKFFMSKILHEIKYICAQTKLDIYKFRKLLPKSSHSKVILAGNTKFDLAFQYGKTFTGSSIHKSSRLIWIAASTHQIEEHMVIQAHAKILINVPDALLILVPRHPERAKLIQKLLNKQNLTFITYEEQSNLHKIHSDMNVYLIDTIGQLNNLYKYSHASFVGGSLIPNIGGHNVLEPAALGLPIAVGPYTHNCQQIIFSLKLKNGIYIVNNEEELSYIIQIWLLNEHLRKTIGNNAKKYLTHQTGAAKINVAIIRKYLN